MNVTLCSAFRNAESSIVRYFHQVSDLERLLFAHGDRLSAIWCEGDSTDDTWRILKSYCQGLDGKAYWPHRVDLLKVDHGGADFGSVVNAERFANLARVWNRIWERIPQDADAILFCESDLIWEPAAMLALLDDLAHVPAVAPMVLLKREGYRPDFAYDGWAFRKDGKHINPMPPYFDGWDMQTPLQIDSAGSCMAIRGDLARQLTWPAEDVIVGVCRGIYEHGGSVWLDPKETVHHL